MHTLLATAQAKERIHRLHREAEVKRSFPKRRGSALPSPRQPTLKTPARGGSYV